MNRIGRYELGPVLGEGGAGRVYEAVLRGPGGFFKPVALKVLHTGTSDLRREARIGGLLRHQNLVDVYEIGEENGQWFAALELCDGTVADHAPLPPRAIVDVALQVCRALQYAHEELELVHLDLKPANLLLANGRVKVANLGIARALGFEADDKIRGTPAYMAPEQAAGWPVDPRTDIYALGITLHDLAVGVPGAASDTLNLTGFGERDPSTLDFSLDDLPELAIDEPQLTTVPAWLEAIIHKCIAPSPAERYASMAELARELATLQVDGPGLRDHIHWIEEVTTAVERRGTNLKPGRDAFVGRKSELVELATLLAQPGIITIKGSAGIGKSRLARTAAWQWFGRRRQAWFVDLVEVNDAAGLLRAIARTVGARMKAGKAHELVEQLSQSLAGRGAVTLVLDNFEQIAPLAPMLEGIVAKAPDLRVLVTSRRPLRLAAEQLVELDPLDPVAAKELLIARARSRGVEVADDPDLVELAHKLDGVPLALELAAGRLGVLSVREVLDRLSLSLLRTGADGRHGTLSAALSWSWDLMTELERTALSQLSVFAGGFTLEAAEEVLALDGSLLDTIGLLVDRSMVRPLDEGRFDLLVSVQEFAASKLDEPLAPQTRHGLWFGQYGTLEALDALLRHGGMVRRVELGTELQNLIVACSRACNRDDAPIAVTTFAAAYEAVDLTGPYEELRTLGQRVVELEPTDERLGAVALASAARTQLSAGFPNRAMELARRAVAQSRDCNAPRIEANARATLGNALHFQGNYAQALEVHREELDLARRHAFRPQQAIALNGIGLALAQLGQLDEAEAAYQTAIEIYREIGHRSSEGAALGNLGGIYQQRRQFDDARNCYDGALAIARELGSRRSEGIWLGNLGILLRVQGQVDEAWEHYQAALAIHREVGNRTFVAITVSNMGRIAAEAGRHDEGRQLLEEALHTCRELGQTHSEAVALANLGALNRVEGNDDQARTYLAQALVIAKDSQDASLIGPITQMLAELNGSEDA